MRSLCNDRTIAAVLAQILKLIGSSHSSQEELTEDQVKQIRDGLAKGEVLPIQAHRLLQRLADDDDVSGVAITLEYMVAMGMTEPAPLRTATNFYWRRRHYAEARLYAERLCYEHDRYGAALRDLSILESLEGDYVPALAHMHEYDAARGMDPELVWFQVDALLRSGSYTAAEERIAATGVRLEWEGFLARRRGGRFFGRFSWHGRPSRSTRQTSSGLDVAPIRSFVDVARKRPLMGEVPDMATLDRLINSGHYVPDERRFGHPDVWIQPSAFEPALVGDCEDFALWAWAHLVRLGYPARFVLCGLFKEEPNHAWVTIHRVADIQLLECTP
ncbi:MAG: hypothetical protein AAF449_25285, partial [Myxococcota bacterium]